MGKSPKVIMVPFQMDGTRFNYNTRKYEDVAAPYMLDHEYVPYERGGRANVELVQAEAFVDKLQLRGLDLGRSKTNGVFRSITDHRTYSMSFKNLSKLLGQAERWGPNLSVVGKWGYEKRGEYYSIVFLEGIGEGAGDTDGQG